MTAARDLGTIPVLLYHSVSTDPSGWIAPFTVTPARLEAHLGAVAEAGLAPVTVSYLRDGLAGLVELPPNPVVVTIDDGFADTLTAAAPLLGAAGIPATVYVTSGFVGGRSPGGDRMMSWPQVRALVEQGHEVGAHSQTHPQLDTLSEADAWSEVLGSRKRLEDALSLAVRSFAYPHGYSSPRVRQMVSVAGFDSACAVKNALSSAVDPPLSIARLTVTATTTDATVRRWLGGSGAPTGHEDERVVTRAWRTYRRCSARRHAGGRR